MAKIAISFINDLQDARYCAAMDCAYVGFCIDPQQVQYLPPTKIREMVAWLSGPKTILACGADSLADLAELEKTLSFLAIKIEEKEWAEFKENTKKPIYLSAEKNVNCAKIEQLIAQVQAYHADSKVIVKISSEQEALDFRTYYHDIFLHFSSLEMAQLFLKNNDSFPFGIYVEAEGYLAEGGLNYEVLDEILM